MSIQCIYMLGSTRVHKCSCRPCMPEYGSKSWTLRLCVCICICEACERYLLMELSVMKIIGVNFIVVWIFCSFNNVFISSYTFKMFWKLIGLLSNYHNNSHIQSFLLLHRHYVSCCNPNRLTLRSCDTHKKSLKSDTMDSGIPWSLMTAFSTNHVMPLTIIIVVVGTRCTCDVSWSIMTNK